MEKVMADKKMGDTYRKYQNNRQVWKDAALQLSGLSEDQMKVKGLVERIRSNDAAQAASARLELENYLRNPETIQNFRELPEAERNGISSLLKGSL